jgi:polynucleotide 5'-kinase involved in rRNA processing
MDTNYLNNKTLENNKVEKLTNVIVIGDKNSGKTTLIQSILSLCRALLTSSEWVLEVDDNFCQVVIKTELGEELIRFIEVNSNSVQNLQIQQLDHIMTGCKNILCAVVSKEKLIPEFGFQSSTNFIVNRLDILSKFFQGSVLIFNEHDTIRNDSIYDGIKENQKLLTLNYYKSIYF